MCGNPGPPGAEEDHGEGGGGVDGREDEVVGGVGLHQRTIHSEPNVVV